MNDKGRLPAPSATNHLDVIVPGRSGVVCVACREREATTRRRTVSYVGTWNLPEPVCEPCAAELDKLAERCTRGVLQVDRAVKRYREAA